MPYDPSLPINSTQVRAEELRAQFQGLKALIDALPAGPVGPAGPQGIQGPPGAEGPAGSDGEVTEISLNAAIIDNTPAKVNHVDPLDPGVATTDYDPVQMQEGIDKLNELILALWRA